ncbi:chorismate--pyruvate lyase [Zoogloeaceae bacteirum Par-f-2]|jgi:chorismate--pyruvate lyase|uniref:chorismate--pyruvate lyase family protein n=1 Tax=Pseudothauera hydrothermalis TaxID=2184083 RepID=UPI000C7B8C35|nr:chorismate lyase [Pseudothauera hydrothermalis]AUL98846.1 chorismate--pyruvate lyase [Rhodocyclaceae bacterium]AVZ78070.1 chorismate--pyruvate lyase [Zoogloeaceae bacteirum Par-f-2]
MRTRLQRETWLRHPPRATVAAALRPWLTDPGSLTARIRARCADFGVRVLSQRLKRPNRDEAKLLGLRAGELAWVREVLLLADGRAVVFARSVLPRHHLRGAWNLFHGLGARPLGAALFADPRIERQPLACIGLDRRDARYHRIAAALAGQRLPSRVWARRSVFLLNGRALLVSEAFAPAILELPA